MKIIAIDPGYERLGIAVIEREQKNKEVLIYSECFKTDKKLPHPERLNLVGKRIAELILKYKPEFLATEKLFFSKNTKTAMQVAETRGIIINEAMQHNLKVREFHPAEIKIAITGHGRSDKKQIIDMLPRLINIKTKISYDDEYDAIACGLTFFAHYRFNV